MVDALPEGIMRTTDPGGRDALRLERGDDAVLVSLLGAQVLSWHHAGRDVLWTASNAEYAPGKPVRGGVPIVFPWFGDAATSGLPAHGFARNLTWRVVAARPGPDVTFETIDDDATRAMWPHAFRLRFTVAPAGDGVLRLALAVENRGGAPITFEEALHTYFAAGDVHSASVHGLEGVAVTEFAREPEPDQDHAAPLRFRAETDRVFQDVPDRIELQTPALTRTVVLETRGARSAIVWNPWPTKCRRLPQMAVGDWQHFVCIESANVKERAVTLATGASHTLSLELRVTAARAP